MENTNITITGISDKGLTLQVAAGKVNYIVWKNKKDGTPTAAFQDLPKLGETVGISYKEEDRTFTGKEGKDITYKQRTILSFLPIIAPEAITTPKIATPPVKIPPSGNLAPTQPSYQESREAFGKRLAVHGMINGMLAAKKPQDITPEIIKEVFALESRINAELENQANLDSLTDSIPF